jgi:hypothetical protein
VSFARRKSRPFFIQMVDGWPDSCLSFLADAPARNSFLYLSVVWSFLREKRRHWNIIEAKNEGRDRLRGGRLRRPNPVAVIPRIFQFQTFRQQCICVGRSTGKLGLAGQWKSCGRPSLFLFVLVGICWLSFIDRILFGSWQILQREIEGRSSELTAVGRRCSARNRRIGRALENRYHRLLLRILEWTFHLETLSKKPAVSIAAISVNFILFASSKSHVLQVSSRRTSYGDCVAATFSPLLQSSGSSPWSGSLLTHVIFMFASQ